MSFQAVAFTVYSCLSEQSSWPYWLTEITLVMDFEIREYLFQCTRLLKLVMCTHMAHAGNPCGTHLLFSVFSLSFQCLEADIYSWGFKKILLLFFSTLTQT